MQSTRADRPDTRLQTGALKRTPGKKKKSSKAQSGHEKKKSGGKGKASSKSPVKSPAKGKGKAVASTSASVAKGKGRSPKKTPHGKQVITQAVLDEWDSEVSASRVSRILPLDAQARDASLATAGESVRVDATGQSMPQTPLETVPRPSERRIRRMKQVDRGMLAHAERVSASDDSSVSGLGIDGCDNLG